ncbi:hypothetical protein SuNHUV7_19720 (plasmid) [Pseudoseohaeicola sp. NH-UV-7]|uniref:universal stress protein n=1 Tax=unclassified Sulfitobacter TaxID=196795 RepID=UPI000E0A341B|nr:universal stress protein [Sulfitobacter sp. JL08]AXI56022.1 universal stress protein UspA [Sulfitobacter sp. JL08]
MFKLILAPVDIAHADKLGNALTCAADLAKMYGASLGYVGVTSSAPSSVARTPGEYSRKLQNFAKSHSDKHGIEITAHTEIAHDPTVEVDDALMRAIDKTGADLVVMASHVPGALEYIWPSNGGKLAEHAKCSVMLVRA